ncbi:MAG: TetR/AcrR family transcriptional regulator [Comamonas sp.]|jgi:AcrR family transcriptional regulator|uniref:TetR/AcrR family transcriptional regulator n=1 Tax=Comamonas sp. TaxID=34028 RepID=UPI00283085DD|nr:TetR/AcrR family transcriptional regulator [Comamonas sp.]MDR0214663.1 TetR/AcrR family transcriptional regulator [Comamonas sp.]MDR2297711.1 TetR/AcrR family transcriptional regulator [Comamonas sp.]
MNQTGSKTAPRRTQAERSQTTQRKIIKSAIRLLQKVGFQQTNLQEIARGAKVTLGAVQHQFGSRQALMEQVVDEIMAPLAAAGAGWPKDAAQLPLEQRAREFVRHAWLSVYEPPSYLATWSMFFGCKSTPLFKRIDAHRSQYDPALFAHFVTVFPEIAERHPQPEHFAAVVFAAFRGIAVMRLFEANDDADEHQLDVITQMIVNAGTVNQA